MKRTIQAALALGTLSFLTLATASAKATVYTFNDSWIDWPGYTSSHSAQDENGTPNIDNLLVTVENGYLTQVQISLRTDKRQKYDSLFINTNYNGSYTGNGTPSDTTWDDWDYFVRDEYGSGHQANTIGTEAGDGFFSVDSGFTYTTTKDGSGWNVRENNPNGIVDNDSLDTLSSDDYVNFASNTITYSFGNALQLNGGFFIAYAPWCANDVIGGGAQTPVPEPATMLLFGTGLAGLATVSRRKLRQS